ncbi:MAG: 3-isopropylmalate dehydratase large subunit [Bacillota bacterium]
MGMTITEKILAAHADRPAVEPGEIVTCRVDLVLGNDVTAPVAIKEFRKIGVDRVFDPERVALVASHFAPNKDIAAATQAKEMRDFAREQGIRHHYDVGDMGIEHALLPEKGLTVPGQVIVGADSHTCTYGAMGAFSTGVGSTDMAAAMATGTIWLKVPETHRFVLRGKLGPWVSGKDLILYLIGQIGVDGALYAAMEFDGPAIRALSMEARLTVANMAIEAGAKSGIISPDEITLAYLRKRAQFPVRLYRSDDDARFARTYEFDVSRLEPQVALPFMPENTRPISEVGDVPVDQVFIGSCTNGRIEDLRVAASLLRGNKVHDGVRCLIIPATQGVYLQAMREGLLEVFLEAGAAVSTPTCGACLGGHMGVLAEGERCLSTTNRNFPGRMGHPKAEVYLASPAVAAATAITGRIAHPREVARHVA